MLLAADVGNTNVKLGIFDGDNLKFKLRFSTDENKTSDELAVELFTFLQIYNIDAKSIDGAIISSVVPKFTYNLRRAIMTVTDRKSLLIGPGLKTGLDIKIEHPETLGADIVAGCVGACEKYGGPLIMILWELQPQLSMLTQATRITAVQSPPVWEFRLTHSQITAHCFHRLI